MRSGRIINIICLSVAAALCAGVLLSPTKNVGAIEYTDYTVQDLLSPCFEGDSDSRWGEAFEVNCEQYIRGFTDAYFHFSAQSRLPEVCFPEGANRLDLIRWAFIKWARTNTDKQGWPATQGLVTSALAEFPCP